MIGFRNSWHPLPANVLYYAPCFCVGWWWLLRHRAGKDVGRNCELHVGCSLLAFAIVLPLVRRHVDVESAGWDRAAVTGLFALFAWLSATGWFGMYLKHLGPAPRAVRYLAEASFWIYLVHHPVVGLAQVALAGSSLPAVAKYAVATGAAILLSLLTCHVLVRDTRIGVLLNGRRASRIAGTQPDEQVPVLPAQAAPRRKAA